MLNVPENQKSLFAAAALRWSVPQAVLEAVAWVESRFNPAVTSPVGAAGLMQIMPANWERLGISDPYDPAQSIDGGARMLSRLYSKYGDWSRVFAAYNWGPGNVDKTDVSKWPDSVKKYTSNVAVKAGLPVPFPLPRPKRKK